MSDFWKAYIEGLEALNAGLEIDAGLRERASADAETAFLFATNVDLGTPHDVTRNGSAADPKWAFHYAYSIDKRRNETTYQAVCDCEPDFWYAIYTELFPVAKPD